MCGQECIWGRLCSYKSTICCPKGLKREQSAHPFEITGILLDKGNPDMDFSLKEFCQDIYRTSQLLEDDIVWELVTKRV